MSAIAFNAVLRIHLPEFDGLFRVVAVATAYDIAFVYQLPPAGQGAPLTAKRGQPVFRQLSLTELERSIAKGKSMEVELTPHARYLTASDQLNAFDKTIFERRKKLMDPFLDHKKLCEHLIASRGRLGPLVKVALGLEDFDRASVYNLFHRLGCYGFLGGSLNPEIDKCGGAGVRRPVDERRSNGAKRKKNGRKTTKHRLKAPEAHPQQGVTHEQSNAVIGAWGSIPAPKPVGAALYAEITERAFVREYVTGDDGGLVPVMPEQGTTPNDRQIRHIIESIPRLKRQLAKTVRRHFERTMRGIPGAAWQGIAGPGHCYVIDSTLADVYLRSSFNRSWIIGRPILYVVVDLWSTAVVGFYLCLTGPSWATAKVALFCTCAPPGLINELYGFEGDLGLTPAPTVPYDLLCDRGEYLSQGARDTQSDLGIIDVSYTPSYRGDLKGIDEVQFRIIKDEQYRFVPGAIDARRAEIELRPDIRQSKMTLREYAHYLRSKFALKNLFANRKKRLTPHMIELGVPGTPAGLWSYGHSVGIGYRKATDESRLITSLLPRELATVNLSGIAYGSQKFEPSDRDLLRELCGMARTTGAYKAPVHVFPANSSRLWWAADANLGLLPMSLALDSRVQETMYFEECLDGFAFSSLSRADEEYERKKALIMQRAKSRQIFDEATRLTNEAEERARGEPMPSQREAREYEGATPKPATMDANLSAVAPDPVSEQYYDLMQHVLERADGGVA